MNLVDKSGQKQNGQKPVASAVFLPALALVSFLVINALGTVSAFAQGYQYPQNVLQYPNPQTAGTATPPPVGSGPTPPAEIRGDQQAGQPPNVPTDQAQTTPTTNFPQGVGSSRTTVYVFRNGLNRGNRMDRTIRPDGLTQDQIDGINAILGINMLDGQETIQVAASEAQLAQIDALLAPYPATINNGGFKQIVADSPAPGYPKEQSSGLFAGSWDASNFNNTLAGGIGYVPTVRYFARWLIIAGVVFATVMMALAAFGMSMGHQYAGMRALGTGVGLITLLSAYTIWKIVEMEAVGGVSNPPAINQNRPQPGTANAGFQQNSGVPIVPNGGRNNPARSGVPLMPLGASQYP